MRVSRTVKKAAAATAVVLLLATGPLAPAPAVAAPTPPNSVPPPVDQSLLDRPAEPKADVEYKPTNKACIASSTGGRPIVPKPHAQMVLRLEDAHQFATGKGVKIAIIDT